MEHYAKTLTGVVQGRAGRLAVFALATVAFTISFGVGTASAKEAVAYFGAESGTGRLGGQFGYPTDIAVNTSGAGPADKGDIYVIESFFKEGDRIQRFAQNDNGTPAEPYDDKYEFISAWGADVDATPSGGSDYEICTVAADCKFGAFSGGNGTTAGNGSFFSPSGVVVDQDTGEVYVSDNSNFRINVYTGDGIFLRSFGFDVVESGPDNTGTGYEVCVAANGDVCKAGVNGSGVGQIGDGQGIAVSQPDGNPATGTVFLADSKNHRIDTYNLDGSGLGSFGSSANFDGFSPTVIAVDSRGIVYARAAQNDEEIERYDSQNANGGGVGFLKPIGNAISVNTGPGGGCGSGCLVTFSGPLAYEDVSQLVASNGTTPLSGGSGASVETTTPGGPGTSEVQKVTVSATAGQFRLTFNGETTADIPFNASITQVEAALRALPSIPDSVVGDGTTFGPNGGLEVDPDSDAAGPDVDVLYILINGLYPNVAVQQFGPVNAPGLTAPPSTYDERHGSLVGFGPIQGLGLDDSNGRLFVSATSSAGGAPAKSGVYVLDEAGGLPTASLDSLSGITATSVTVHATVDPNGPPPVSYHLEYSLDGSKWMKTAETVVGTQEGPQVIEAALDPPGTGLEPSTFYHVRLVATKVFTPPVTTSELTFTTLPAPPIAETVGSPVRSATTAQLGGRVTPRKATTVYHFEYGDQGPCESNPCTVTPDQSAGSGSTIELVSEEVSELEPNTTYHYRILADNGNPGSPVFGGDMIVRTRPSDEPLSHGHFPGPPGSDRAYEQITSPDTGGNPLDALIPSVISDDGSRAVYGIGGGTPISNTGGFSQYYAERPSGAHPQSGWQTRTISPAREDLVGPNWTNLWASSDLSAFVAESYSGVGAGTDAWRISPDAPPQKLNHASAAERAADFIATSDDVSTVVTKLKNGAPDPQHPTTPGTANLYEIGAGVTHLVSLLPDDTVPTCGVSGGGGSASSFVFPTIASPTEHWVSADGSLLFFTSKGNSCGGQSQLYVRDLEAEETEAIPGPPISGPSCAAAFIKSIPGAVFLWTQSRLDSSDTTPDGCSESGSLPDGDIYRYDLGDGSAQCLTCVVADLDADVHLNSGAPASSVIAVAGDGSRIYFTSPNRLLPGAAANGAYRVDTKTGELAYVGLPDTGIGDGTRGNALTPDGSVLVFRSKGTSLNPLGGGTDNGGTLQYYRYDDRDRSLLCISCPQDGSQPRGAVPAEGEGQALASADGETVAFDTPSALALADQNTAGPVQDPVVGKDAYEWREGRLLLVSDGLTNWTGFFGAPEVQGITPSGRDLIFAAATQYTPDALDDYRRLYDARIGGGIVFPQAPPPCPLEVCQGTPKGAPEEAAPGTGAFAGPGNAKPKQARCAKGKQRRKGRCVVKKPKRAHHRRANHDRRTAR